MKPNWLIVAIFVLLFVGGGRIVYDKSRGLRNNNPGNLRHGEPWQGLRPVQTDASFAQFISPEYGIRAMTKVLRTYSASGINTIRGIINRWAPAADNNDTASYIAAVSQALNLAPSAPLDMDDAYTLAALIAAIIRHENGVQPYSAATIARGIALAA